MHVFYAKQNRHNMGKPGFFYYLFKDSPTLKGLEITEDIYGGPEDAIHPDDLARAKGLPAVEPTPVRPEEITDAPPVTPVASVSAEIAEDTAQASTPEPELTPAQKAAATRATNKAKAEAAAAKRAAKKAQ